MSTARRRPRVDLSFGPGHGPVSGVLNAAGFLYALTMWLYLGHASPAWGLCAGVMIGATGVAVARWYDQPSRVLWYRALCWCSAGVWSCWVLLGFHGVRLWPWHVYLFTAFNSPDSPWSWRPFFGLAVGAAVVAALGWSIQAAERRAEREADKTAAQLAAEAEARLAAIVPVHDEEGIAFRWRPFLEKITKSKIDVKAVEKWNPFNGFTLDCELPADGTVLSDIKSYEEALAAAAPEGEGGLPEGCGVEIMANPGFGRRCILIRVTTISALERDIPYPDDLSPDSIENRQAIGVITDGSVKTIPMRYECVVLVGNTDSGKSNQLNTVTADLARCTDAIKVAIDLSGNGRFARPWLRAYRDGRAERPVFAQVAPTAHRARLLCQSLLNIINGRTADYADLMHSQNSDKILVSPALAQIVLVVDEFGELPDDVKDMIKSICDTGRGAAVRVVSCALEATGGYIPRPVITQSRVRLGMRVVDETQLQYLFDSTWRRGRFDPASLPWKGSGLVADGPAFPEKFKGFRIEPEDVYKISVATGSYQPELDDASLARGDTVTIKVMTELGREEMTFTGVWTEAEAETYPLIFSNVAAGMTGAGAAGGTPSGAVGTHKEVPNVSTAQDELNTAMGGVKGALGALDDAMAALEAEANATDKPDADGDADATTGDDKEGDAGDGEPAPRRGPAISTPSPDDLQAWFDAPTVQEPPAGGRPAGPGPWDGTPGSTPPAHPVTYNNTGGQVPPKRRLLELVAAAAPTGGIGPSDAHRDLIAGGYATSLTTVQNWFKELLGRGVLAQPGGPRTAYLPGPKFPKL